MISARKIVCCMVVVLWLLPACLRYERKVPSFRMPEAFSNMQQVAGANVAVRAYVNEKEANKAFGFDVSKAGLLPLQVIFDNRGQNKIEINPAQTFLVDAQGNAWPVMKNDEAYERISKTTEFGNIAKGAVRRGTLGVAAGAIIGAAVGIVSGENVMESAGKGAAVGAATGATLGGAEVMSGGETEYQISEDLRNRSLKNRVIEPGEVAYGFLFFPAEAVKGTELRLQLVETETGERHNLHFLLEP